MIREVLVVVYPCWQVLGLKKTNRYKAVAFATAKYREKSVFRGGGKAVKGG
jgi:hypothetical protein